MCTRHGPDRTPQAALADLDRAIELGADGERVHRCRAQTLWGAGDSAGALAEAETALELAPDGPSAHAVLGNILDQLGRTDEAFGAGWGKEKAMCLIDLRTGTWSGTRAVTPPGFSTGFYALVPSVVYDEATERTVFSDGRQLAAYDAAADRWEILAEAVPGVSSPSSVPLLMAYDPLHRRLVGVGWDERPDVAFDPVTGEWTVLLEASQGQPAP